MTRTLVAKYAGTCDRCHGSFPRGATINYGGRGAVTHEDCTPLARVKLHGRSMVLQGYEHTGTRCLDAPCCGCC